MVDTPGPEITPLSEPYWQGLANGTLLFQKCSDCGYSWLPPRDECPHCLSSSWAWTPSLGRGRIISWVIYRTAMHPAFAERIPYNVAIVELDEGPRLITNVLADESDLAIELPVVLSISDHADPPLATFKLIGGD